MYNIGILPLVTYLAVSDEVGQFADLGLLGRLTQELSNIGI